MKKFTALLFITALLSCTKKPIYEEAQVVGTWIHSSDGLGIRVTYKEDNTYSLMVRSMRSRSKQMYGTWHIEDNVLITNHRASRSKSVQGRVNILELTDSMMVTQSDEGTVDTTWRE